MRIFLGLVLTLLTLSIYALNQASAQSPLVPHPNYGNTEQERKASEQIEREIERDSTFERQVEINKITSELWWKDNGWKLLLVASLFVGIIAAILKDIAHLSWFAKHVLAACAASLLTSGISLLLGASGEAATAVGIGTGIAGGLAARNS